MKKMFAVQVVALLLVSGALAGMFAFTPVYNEVRSGIVLVLCLSCLKLEPNTATDFTFETVDNVPHPPFVLENLTKGPVFLHYSGDSCAGCDVMYPIIKELFSVNFGKQDMFHTLVMFDNSTVAYIYINIHHTIDELRDAQSIYDKDRVGGIPMFTIVTLGYDNGNVKPKFRTLYGTLATYGCNTDAERLTFLQELMKESIEMYNQNKAGYHPY
jgi:thiol-disulfide isomerase/thioredoxin